MLLRTIVEDYVTAALSQAVVEKLEDGTLAAYVPECKGVLAFGADHHECAAELYRRLEDWIKVWLTRGYKLPIIDGLDLNQDPQSILGTYHPDHLAAVVSEFYEDEDQLKAAFKKHGEP